MKKLALMLLMSCVVETASASDKLDFKPALKFTGIRVLPAAVGYMAADRVGLYGSIAICGLASLNHVFSDKRKAIVTIPADVETVLNSLAFGVAAHKAVKFAPTAVNKLTTLYRK